MADNKDKTAEKFIKRMISHCTYLLDEYALANNSILYSEFKVMNELKQIRVNDRKLELKFQQQILEDFFKKTSGTITERKFKNYLISTKKTQNVSLYVNIILMSKISTFIFFNIFFC